MKRIVLSSIIILLSFTLMAYAIGREKSRQQINNIDVSIYQYHNAIRIENGMNTLDRNEKLDRSASAKAAIIAKENCWSHSCPSGAPIWDTIDNVGYDYIYVGENLAKGYDSNEELMEAWMDSPTHRKNILNENFDHVGIGFSTIELENGEFVSITVVHYGSTISNYEE